MVVLDGLVVVTALPLIHHDVGGDVASLQWILSGYLLAFGAGIITAASLGDRYGRRNLFVLGLTIFSVSSAACALSPDIVVLILARVVQGVGAAIVMPTSLSILVASFPPQRRGAVLGIFGGVAGVAVAAGPVVGGGITQALTWHWIFWINVPIGIVAAALSMRLIPESHGDDSRLDLGGAAIVTAASVALLWGLIRGGSLGWYAPEVILSFAVGVVLLGALAIWERTAESPILPARFFRNRTFLAANIVAFLSLGALISAALFMSQYFQYVLGYSPFDAGIRFLPWTATPLIVAPLAGRLADRIGPRPLMIIGLLLQAVGLAAIIDLASPTISYEALVPALIVAGVGISMVLPCVPLAAFSAVPRAEFGKASGIFNSMQRFGGAFVIAGATAAFTAEGSLRSASQFVSGLRHALAVSAVLSVLGALISVAVTDRTEHRPASADPIPEATAAAG